VGSEGRVPPRRQLTITQTLLNNKISGVAMAIIVSKDGKDAERIDKSGFAGEDYLQKYIHENPESLPLYEIDEDIKMLIVSREFPTNSGPIDALGIDMDGQIYVVETKLYKNPDKRRVVAQLLDYGAALWRSPGGFSDFRSAMDEHVRQKFNVGLEEKLEEFFGLQDDEITTLMENIEDNLKSGNLRFVVLMDKLDERLRDLIVFLNQNSNFALFGVEMEYYRFREYEILIPKLFGAEVKSQTQTARGPRWTEDRFFRDAEARIEQNQVDSVRALYEFSKKNADRIAWGTGAKLGSFNPKFDKISVRSLYTVYSDGILQLNFSWLYDSKTAESYRDEFFRRLDGPIISGRTIDERVQLPIREWERKLSDFTNIIGDLLSWKGNSR